MHKWPADTAHAYMIKKGNETKYCNPSNVSWSPNAVTWSWNDWNAQFHDEKFVAVKAKLIWTFDGDDPNVEGCSTIKEIMSWLMKRQITDGNRFFDVYSWFEGLGWKWGTFYLGTPTNMSGEGIPGGNSKEMAIEKMELHWIEVGGPGSGTMTGDYDLEATT